MITMFAHVTIGEWLVTVSAVLAGVATLLLWQLTRIADRDMRENTEVLRKANELSLRSLEHVAVNANDDMADVATAAITRSAPVGRVHVRRIARIFHTVKGSDAS